MFADKVVEIAKMKRRQVGRRRPTIWLKGLNDRSQRFRTLRVAFAGERISLASRVDVADRFVWLLAPENAQSACT